MLIKKEEKKAFRIQVAVWMVLFILPPTTTWIVTHKGDIAWTVIKDSYPYLFTLALLFFINVYSFVPDILYKDNKRKFYGINLAISVAMLVLMQLISYLKGSLYLSRDVVSYAFGTFFQFGYYWGVMAFAILMRASMQREVMQNQLKEEKQKRVEAELTMLKSQLNPHFLFNTLNNISSLVQIDADAAQESIGQLSDLLRYSLYDSNQKQMPIEREIEFMKNYIDLMKLRCNELADIRVDIPQLERSVNIVPMLFISLIENAFKHGINSRTPSFVHFSLLLNDDILTFTSENSLFPKPDTDRIGSGIGIANTKHRLDLAYSNRYEYIHEQRGNTYFAQISIKCL